MTFFWATRDLSEEDRRVFDLAPVLEHVASLEQRFAQVSRRRMQRQLEKEADAAIRAMEDAHGLRTDDDHGA